MKFFDIDWQAFIAQLPAWSRLSTKARQTLVQMKTGQSIPIGLLDGQERAMVEAGFVERLASKKKVRLAPGKSQPFVSAVRAMFRNDILTDSSEEALTNYLREYHESSDLADWDRARDNRHGAHYLLAREASSIAWLENFLAEETTETTETEDVSPRKRRFLRRRTAGPRTNNRRRKRNDNSMAPLAVARQIARRLASKPEFFRMQDLPALFPDIPSDALSQGIVAGIRRLVLFPALARKEMTVVLTLWPTIYQRLHRPKLPVPPPVAVESTFSAAMVMEDMTAVLATTMAGPPRLRGNDQALFAKVQQEIKSILIEMPQWVDDSVGIKTENRVEVALCWLRSLELVRNQGVAGEDLRLHATKRGSVWLAKSGKERLKGILDTLRTGNLDALGGEDDGDDGYDFDSEFVFRPEIPFLPFSINGLDSDDYLRLRRALATAWDALPDKEGFVSYQHFIRWRVQESNPLVEVFADSNKHRRYNSWNYSPPTPEELDENWLKCLTAFVFQRLLMVGGLAMGRSKEHEEEILISLTGVGRYLLGLADDFDYGHQHEAGGQVVVQPNFEVVFLTPAPMAEVAVARFAERKSKGVGSLFRITKKSVLGAAAGGMDSEQVLDTLGQISTKGVPANVKREISGWFDQCRHINIRSTILIECPDATTAARVASAGGSRTASVSDTLVELTESGAKAEILRKLRDLGVFAQESTKAEVSVPVKKGRPRKRRSKRSAGW